MNLYNALLIWRLNFLMTGNEVMARTGFSWDEILPIRQGKCPICGKQYRNGGLWFQRHLEGHLADD